MSASRCCRSAAALSSYAARRACLQRAVWFAWYECLYQPLVYGAC